jgi:D-alanyl-D-alanine carboxypeptidase
MKVKAKKTFRLKDGRQVRKGAVTEVPAREAVQLVKKGFAQYSSKQTLEEKIVESSQSKQKEDSQKLFVSKDLSETPKPVLPPRRSEQKSVWEKIKKLCQVQAPQAGLIFVCISALRRLLTQ